MAGKPANKFPSYPKTQHKSGQARITLRGKSVYLGEHGSPKSYQEYNRLLAEWCRTQAEQSTADTVRLPGECRTVQDLVARWSVELERRFPGTEKHHPVEQAHYRAALQPVLDLYGHTPVADFGPRALKTVRSRFVEIGWCRNHVNRQTTRVKTVWRWAKGEELLPPGLHEDLWAVKALDATADVRETEEVPPADEATIQAILPELSPLNRAIVDLLLLTGARPSELFRLTPGMIDRQGQVELSRGYKVKLGEGVWAVRLEKHKTRGKGGRRFLVFGAKAQAILSPLMTDLSPTDRIFTPARGVALWREHQRAHRKTSVQPSQRSRALPNPRRRPGEEHSANALGDAIDRAIDRANAKRAEEGQPLLLRFTPYMLRHNAAARLRDEFGEEVAAAVLGHTVEMTRRYALHNVQAAAEAMGKAG